MLFDELTYAREDAYRAYRAPLRNGIMNLGQIIFGPDLDVELDEELKIVKRTLGKTTLPWESLSAGAREQLAVLTALAAAQIAAADGVPLILDDMLGYTDPDRLERLGAVLGSADDAQVIILTCMASRYQHVGGAKTIRLREAKPTQRDPEAQPAAESDGTPRTPGPHEELLTCKECGRDWVREIKPGRKPSTCPSC